MKSKQERMFQREDKKFFRLLNDLSRCNPDVVFLFDNDRNIIADSKYVERKINREMKFEDLTFPGLFGGKYYFGKCSDTKNAIYYANSVFMEEDPFAFIEVDNSEKTMYEGKYDGFYVYEEQEPTFKDSVMNALNKAKNSIKYLFTKRSNAKNDYEKVELDEFLRKEAAKEEKEAKQFTQKINNKQKEEQKQPVKQEEKKVEPKKEEKEEKISKESKEDLLLDKYYTLLNRRAYVKLGEYEKMFIDDAKAECLVPGDNEFNMMLNERTVNKEQVISFMKEYKTIVTNEKSLISKYSNYVDFEKINYSELSINDLRKTLANNKSMLTGPELEKQKKNTFKKDELVELMNRIDAKKLENETARKLGL